MPEPKLPNGMDWDHLFCGPMMTEDEAAYIARAEWMEGEIVRLRTGNALLENRRAIWKTAADNTEDWAIEEEAKVKAQAEEIKRLKAEQDGYREALKGDT